MPLEHAPAFDPTAAEEFLQRLDPTTDKFTFQTFDGGVCVSRKGGVGLYIPDCPLCGEPHIHGPYYRFHWDGVVEQDPREMFAALNGARASHCNRGDRRNYRLTPMPGVPVRYAPLAKGSQAARDTTAYLKRLGLKTSNEIMPSTWLDKAWRWR
jgi:hypothetical protein